MSMMSDHEEHLDAFPAETKEKPAEFMVEHFAQGRQIFLRQEGESQRGFHLSLMDRRPGFSARS